MPEPVRFTEADVNRLGQKLDSLDLDENERGLLDAIFATARSAVGEVGGYALNAYVPSPSLSQGLQNTLDPVKKVGFPNLGKNAIEYV